MMHGCVTLFRNKMQDSDIPSYETIPTALTSTLKTEDVHAHKNYGNNPDTHTHTRARARACTVCVCVCVHIHVNMRFTIHPPKFQDPKFLHIYSYLYYTHTDEAMNIKQSFNFISLHLPCMSTHSSSLVSTSSFFFFSSFLRSFFLFSIFPSLQIKVIYYYWFPSYNLLH